MFNPEEVQGSQVRLAPFTQQILKEVQQTAIELSDVDINDPLKIAMLSKMPDIFILHIVEFTKLHTYIETQKVLLQTNEEYLMRLLVLYRRKFINMRTQEVFYVEEIAKDLKFINQVVQRSISSRVVNQFIRLYLAASRLDLHRFFKIKIWELLLSLGQQIQYEVFFDCIGHFITNPTFEFPPNTYERFIHLIQKTLERFLDSFDGKETDHQVHRVRQLITEILFLYSNNCKVQDCSSFVRNILTKIMIRYQFCCTFFIVMKKYGILKENYRKWIEALLNINQGHLAIKLVEFGLSNFSNLVHELQIVQLVEDNQEWAAMWIAELIKNNFYFIPSLFLGGDPIHFIILNKLLVLYKFQCDEDFYSKLTAMDYFFTARKLLHHEQAKNTSIELFANIVGVQQYNYLFQDSC